MDTLLSRFTRKSPEDQPMPSMERVCLAMDNPSHEPIVTDYLSTRPELHWHLGEFIFGVTRISHEMIQIAAYFRFRRREQRGDWPLEGREMEDWHAAEKELLEMMEKIAAAA